MPGKMQLCPELHYRRLPEGLLLTGCYGQDGEIYLPDEIGGIPIVGIASMPFPRTKQKAQRI